MRKRLRLGGLTALIVGLSGVACQQSGQSPGGDRDVPVDESLDVADSKDGCVAKDNPPVGGKDIGWVGGPHFCEMRPDFQECSTIFFNGICGLNEAERLMELGQCPPADRSVIGEGQRLILGGDPAHKTTLPEGAQCPQGFERLPRVVLPHEACGFQPTCWEVGAATRIPEPAILDGKYILSGLDAIYLADPLAGWSNAHHLFELNEYGFDNRLWGGANGWESLANVPRRCEGTLENGECQGCWVLDDPWPSLALQATPPPAVEDGRMKVCAAKEGPWIDMDRREVVAQYGGFFTDVIIRDFRTGECTLPVLRMRTHCCGPILMLWPEEIAELRASLEPICLEKRAKAMEEASKHGTEPFYGAFVVAPRTRGLVYSGFAAEWYWGAPHAVSCAESVGCQICTAHATKSDADWSCLRELGYYKAESILEASSILAKCLLSGVGYSSRVEVSGYRELELTLDENGVPVTVSRAYPVSCQWVPPDECTSWGGGWKCESTEEVSVPYRTPEEVAAEIPPL